MIIRSVFIFCFLFRLISLCVSLYNERVLKYKGAVEYGKGNSIALTLAHVLFYGCCIAEASYTGVTFNQYSSVGIGLFIFSMIMLWWVIFLLGGFWTVKLIISPDHVLKTNFLFQYVRHPNYYLNIIPELISIALLCNAWRTLLIGLPLYAIPLIIRIRQEEKVMKAKFQTY